MPKGVVIAAAAAVATHLLHGCKPPKSLNLLDKIAAFNGGIGRVIFRYQYYYYY